MKATHSLKGAGLGLRSEHYQYIVEKHDVLRNVTSHSHPFYVTSADVAFQVYHNGYLRLLETGNRTELHPTDKLILQGALRPAPKAGLVGPRQHNTAFEIREASRET